MNRYLITLSILKLVLPARPPILDPDRFPQVDITILPVGSSHYRISSFIDLGSSTRVFAARRVGEGPALQMYRPPPDIGRTLSGVDIPEELVIKCLSTNVTRLLNSMENEFEIFRHLNPVDTVRKPVGFYLSPRWQCNQHTEFMCQYIAMTLENHDIDRSISRNTLNLRHPALTGVPRVRDAPGNMYSFEVFVASFGLALIHELENLHSAGFAHGDVRVPNVAVDRRDRRHVFLLDVGASKVLSQADDPSNIEQLKAHDFSQIPRLLLRMISSRVHRSYGSVENTRASQLYQLIDRMGAVGKDGLSNTLTGFLADEYGETQCANLIIYKYIPV